MESYKPQRPSPSDSAQSHGSRDEELVNKASAPVANHTGSPPAGSEQKTSAAKRLACDQCRQRKVKCNKEYPQCSRCAKVDIGCTYSTRKKTSPEKMGLSHFLLTLNSRLEQAEAQLAFPPPSKQDGVHSGVSLLSGLDKDEAMVTVTALGQSSSSENLSGAGSLMSTPGENSDPFFETAMVTDSAEECMEDGGADFHFETFTNELILAQSLPDAHQGFDFDPMVFDTTHSAASSNGGLNLSASLVQGFYDRFFDVFHPIMPMINRTRFQAEISESPPSVEVQVLSHAIAVLGTFSVPELRPYTDYYYEQARSLLELCERQEGGTSLTNINTLQACVLLNLYEFKRPNFARAWMTLGRAIRIAKIMGIDKANITPVADQWGFRGSTSGPETPPSSEEKRRTFWVLYIFDSFASVRTNSSSAFDTRISVPLPSSRDYPDFSTPSDTMPPLEQLFTASTTTPLSSFAATSVMIYLYQRCFQHVQSAAHQGQGSMHAFWETHYDIEKAIHKCRTSIMVQHLAKHAVEDPLSLTLRINLNTVELNLQETALARIRHNQLPNELTAAATAKCATCAADTVEALQMGLLLKGNKLEMFRQLDQFLIWPITTTIQTYFRLLYTDNRPVDAAVCINAVRVLSSSMRDLIDPEHIAPGFLDRADQKVVEAEQMNGWRHYVEV
ncbi:hypothetical protein G7054_g11329 [Neopestalotiopsis clavispora]|nr:hypothetical protein G7054_g11329 [Neopestalotiopsis clavispora]